MIVEGSTALTMITMPMSLIGFAILILATMVKASEEKKKDILRTERDEINQLIKDACEVLISYKSNKKSANNEKNSELNSKLNGYRKKIEYRCGYISKIEEDLDGAYRSNRNSIILSLVDIAVGYGIYMSISFPVTFLTNVLIVVFYAILSVAAISFVDSLQGLVTFHQTNKMKKYEPPT